MNREELIDFLRENLQIDLSLDRLYESDGDYVTANLTVSIDGEVISNSYSSVTISK
jgi:hypothetical protein